MKLAPPSSALQRLHCPSLSFLGSRSGASVAEAVVGFLDDETLKRHKAPAGSCSPMVVVLCMTSDCVNAVAASLRSAAPKALVGKMYVSHTSPRPFSCSGTLLRSFNYRILTPIKSLFSAAVLDTRHMYSGGGGALVKREVQDAWLRGSGSAAHVLVATPVSRCA
jgi:hypothetical protein